MHLLYGILFDYKLNWPFLVSLIGCALVAPFIYRYVTGEVLVPYKLQIFYRRNSESVSNGSGSRISTSRSSSASNYYLINPSLHPNKWTKLMFLSKRTLSPNTSLYKFKLRHDNEKLNIPTSHYVAVRVILNGKEEIRNYTPIHTNENVGCLDLVVKTYTLGRVSKYFTTLKPGDYLEFKGPMGEFVYEDVQTTQLGLIAGGSGITPILEVLNEYMSNPDKLEKVCLIYANETVHDILLKEELDSMMTKYPQFHVYYVLHYPPSKDYMISCGNETWTGGIGYITKRDMEQYLPECADDHRLLICGPPEMTNMVLNYARSLGWNSGFQKSKSGQKVFVF